MDPQQPPSGTPPSGTPPSGTGPTGYPPTGYPPTGYPPPMPARPGHVTAAAVILIVLGVLAGLFGVLTLLAGSIFGSASDVAGLEDQFGELPEWFGSLMMTFGAIFLGFGTLQVASGIYVLPGKTWARITGLIVATLGGLFALVLVLPGESGLGGGAFVPLLFLAGYVYVIWVLASHGRWFVR